MEVILGVSNRHVHLTRDTYFKLFGNEELGVVKELRQPGQFASDKFVTIKNGDREIDRVRVLGPFRDYDQVEISRTDSYFLRVNPPIRDSGDLDGSSPITLVTPRGEAYLNNGCIIANRHIHINPKEVLEYGLDGVNLVKIKVSGEKGGILDNVHLKVDENYKFELHLDTDDGNAFGVKTGDLLEIIKEDE